MTKISLVEYSFTAHRYAPIAMARTGRRVHCGAIAGIDMRPRPARRQAAAADRQP
jgi:hypothetical protein